MNVKMAFTIPEEISQRLKDEVAQRKRSAFVAGALEEKLKALERERLEEELTRGYIERYEEDRALNKEWEAVTLEGWPDYEFDEDKR